MTGLSSLSLARLLLVAPAAVLAAVTVDVNDAASIKKAAAVVAGDLMSLYTGETPGLLPGPPPDGAYYPWTGGALWTAMLDYRSRTGDTQYDAKISEGLAWQRGQNNDYLPANWSASAGNDDQSIWAMAALLAAETGFIEPPADSLQWVTLAQNVFTEQSSTSRRVETGNCAGGLRWQIGLANNGYNYVETLASAAYADLGVRLSVQDDNNQTQIKAALDTFKFLQTKKFIDSDFNVFSGAQAQDCSQVNKVQVSLTAALALEAAALGYNATGGAAEWKDLVSGLAGRTLELFFPSGVATEIACEPSRCTTDMTFYKAYLHRAFATTIAAAPYTAGHVLPVLKLSAAAAVKTCTGGANKRMCDSVWSGGSSGMTGAGQQMSVLSALLSILPAEHETAGDNNNPTSSTGGGNATNSQGASAAGSAKPSTTPGSSAGASTAVSGAVLLGSLLLAVGILN
ncbi:glycosyl hydrolase family 76-domain-containing protein [Nemania sp. FL0916]|nr:glycosyl hydrolase family 76-domain-containing protein [Nemania sp. FL0916]